MKNKKLKNKQNDCLSFRLKENEKWIVSIDELKEVKGRGSK